MNALNQIKQRLTSEQTPAQQHSNFQQGRNTGEYAASANANAGTIGGKNSQKRLQLLH